LPSITLRAGPRALAAIRANGTYETLRKKYFDYDIYGQ